MEGEVTLEVLGDALKRIPPMEMIYAFLPPPHYEDYKKLFNLSIKEMLKSIVKTEYLTNSGNF